MSKWGIEEKETLAAIDKIGLTGNILDVAAGDGTAILVQCKAVHAHVMDSEIAEIVFHYSLLNNGF